MPSEPAAVFGLGGRARLGRLARHTAARNCEFARNDSTRLLRTAGRRPLRPGRARSPNN